MSTINVTDKLGLNITTTPAALSALSKYLQDPPSISAILSTVKDIRNLKISDDPFSSQSLGLEFTEPVKLGSTGVELDIQPSLTGTVAIATGKSLFDAANDPFGDTIPIPANNAYVSLAIQAILDLTAKAAADLKFGFTDGKTVTFTTYRLFPVSAPIVDALRALLTDFVIPGDIPDIDAMPNDGIATVASSGSLKLSAEFDLPSSVNALATVTDTVAGGLVKLSAGASADIKAVFTVTGGYQIRVHRLNGRKFEIGFLKQRSSELDVTVEADVGATATAAGTDWIEKLMQMASSDPKADQDVLKNAGLTADQISTINSAIKTGVERSLQLSISAELDDSKQGSTAFSYQIDLDQVDADTSGATRNAINTALDGDLTLIEAGGLKGVTALRSVFSNMKQRKGIMKINVLGILGFASISNLAQQGTVIVDADSGALTITDKATASRIGFTSLNFAKDNEKLRQILAESFMITAAYRTAGILPSAQFGTSLWFFEFRQKTNLANIADYLNIASALGVRTSFQVSNDLGSLQTMGNQLGRSAFNVNATYDGGLFRSLFLDSSGAARQREEYDGLAREALLALLPGNDSTSASRRFPLSDQSAWDEMRKNWNTDDQLTNFFENHPALQSFKSVIMSDYLLIIWWSGAMSGMAAALAALMDFFTQNPKWGPEDNNFKQLHNKLNKAMANVASDTRNDFREPLGLLSMDFASGQKASTTAQLSSPKLSFTAVR